MTVTLCSRQRVMSAGRHCDRPGFVGVHRAASNCEFYRRRRSSRSRTAVCTHPRRPNNIHATRLTQRRQMQSRRDVRRCRFLFPLRSWSMLQLSGPDSSSILQLRNGKKKRHLLTSRILILRAREENNRPIYGSQSISSAGSGMIDVQQGAQGRRGLERSIGEWASAHTRTRPVVYNACMCNVWWTELMAEISPTLTVFVTK